MGVQEFFSSDIFCGNYRDCRSGNVNKWTLITRVSFTLHPLSTISGAVYRGREGGEERDSNCTLTAEEGPTLPTDTHTTHWSEVKGQLVSSV